MKCPKCGGKTRVVKVREKENFTWRVRRCNVCNFQFQTKEMPTDNWDWKVMYEKLEKNILKVIKEMRE